MASSLSNIVNNLSERFHKTKLKYGHDDKKYKTWGIKCKYCNSFKMILTFNMI